MKTSHLIIVLCSFFLASACKSTKKSSDIEQRILPELTVKPDREPIEIYRGSNTILNELVNTKLEVSFDWNKQYLFGKAIITLQPHFYPQNMLYLNARGMEIKDVRLLSDKDSLKLNYKYENDSLKITLDKTYKMYEQFRIYINYISKPEELKDVGGSSAITSDKGLYFINPKGEDKDKPMQIWTQGETQSNSVWFPTIDSPNQKMTQEISITIDSAYTTLSNGLLIKSVKNNNGTRTDTWKQTLPHAPYLAMMAIGKFAVVKDQWRGKEVSYYVEPEYKDVARKIFGNTPEMMEFYSNKLKFDFVWDKYNSVVVRDYVSGAMENSSATLFGEFMEKDSRELLDGNYESIVSHELFHHWFGDLVTCESWSNVPLNESFANYGEYLWDEYKYGRSYADIGLQKTLNAYFREAKNKQVDLIRFQYDDREDMFDRHTYEKGGNILHMLRKYVGDSAFFASLHLYLETNKFKAVEAHQLRLAFEEVTGEDFNWFFNEWFFNKGNMNLDISYSWDENSKQESITVEQLQDLKTTPLYKMPVDIDIYENGKVRRERIWLKSQKEIFNFTCGSKPELVNFDAEKCLLAVKLDHHSTEEWTTLFNKSNLYLDKYEALQNLSKHINPATPQAEAIKSALKDTNWKIRDLAMHNVDDLTHSDDSKSIKETLMQIAAKDVKTSNRTLAMTTLSTNYSDDDVLQLYKSNLTDSSYNVMETAVQELMEHDSVNGLTYVRNLENDKNPEVMVIVSGVYAKYGDDKQMDYMSRAFISTRGTGRYKRIQNFARFLQRCNQQEGIENGLLLLRDEADKTQSWYSRLAITQGLSDLNSKFSERERQAEKDQKHSDIDKYTSLQIIAAKYLEDIKKSDPERSH